MRITNLDIHQQAISRMVKTQEEMLNAQNRLTLGKKFLHGSDNPIITTQTKAIDVFEQKVQALTNNISNARNRLDLEETTLRSFNSTLQRISELWTQSMNAALNEQDRAGIANELTTHLEQLLGLANTKDAAFGYIFGGFQTDTLPFTRSASGNVGYNGDAGQISLNVNTSLQLQISDSGFDVFHNIPNGNGTFYIRDPAAANTGSLTIKDDSVIDPSAFVQEDCTISFISPTQFTVTGSVSGAILPATNYVSGQPINFNGMSITLEGSPQTGDDFLVSPSKGQNIFDTVQNMINKLNQPLVTTSQKANFKNTMQSEHQSFMQGMNRVLDVITKIGSRGQALTDAEDFLKDMSNVNLTAVAQLEGLDYTQGVTEFNLHMQNYQYALQSYYEMQKLSLFNILS